MSKKHPDTERFGGPGSSHQDRIQGEDEHAHAADKPMPGEPTNGPRSKISGGGERDIHHTHEERPKGKGKF